MQKIDQFNLLPPGICVLCETDPDRELIDTEFTLKTGVYSPLNGRKYVCALCAQQIADLLGYEHGDKVKQSKIDADFAERQFQRLQSVVKAFAEQLANLIEHPGVVDEVKPSVEEVFPEPVVQTGGGTSDGVDVPDDEEGQPSVPSPAAKSAAKSKPKAKAKEDKDE